MCDLITIDGSLLEGGGQILRIAITLSCIRKIPIKIINIRAGRKKPGLMEQHLKGIELVRDLCNAKVKGATPGSTEVQFHPGKTVSGNFRAHIKTAGSISLLLQVALPCALFAPGEVVMTLEGGTNADMAPQVDYTTEVFRRNLEKFGATFDFDLVKRGYFPKGGGEVVVTVQPIDGGLKSINLTDRGNIDSIYGWSFVAGTLPVKIANDYADSASKLLRKPDQTLEIERYKEDRNIAPDNCSGLILVAESSTNCILGASALGKRNENAGEAAAKELLKTIEVGACVDQYCQDQIIVFMALARGISRVKVGDVTMHTKTAIYIVETLTKVKFEIIPTGNCNIIECSGGA